MKTDSRVKSAVGRRTHDQDHRKAEDKDLEDNIVLQDNGKVDESQDHIHVKEGQDLEQQEEHQGRHEVQQNEEEEKDEEENEEESQSKQDEQEEPELQGLIEQDEAVEQAEEHEDTPNKDQEQDPAMEKETDEQEEELDDVEKKEQEPEQKQESVQEPVQEPVQEQEPWKPPAPERHEQDENGYNEDDEQKDAKQEQERELKQEQEQREPWKPPTPEKDNPDDPQDQTQGKHHELPQHKHERIVSNEQLPTIDSPELTSLPPDPVTTGSTEPLSGHDAPTATVNVTQQLSQHQQHHHSGSSSSKNLNAQHDNEQIYNNAALGDKSKTRESERDLCSADQNNTDVRVENVKNQHDDSENNVIDAEVDKLSDDTNYTSDNDNKLDNEVTGNLDHRIYLQNTDHERQDSKREATSDQDRNYQNSKQERKDSKREAKSNQEDRNYPKNSEQERHGNKRERKAKSAHRITFTEQEFERDRDRDTEIDTNHIATTNGDSDAPDGKGGGVRFSAGQVGKHRIKLSDSDNKYNRADVSTGPLIKYNSSSDTNTNTKRQYRDSKSAGILRVAKTAAEKETNYNSGTNGDSNTKRPYRDSKSACIRVPKTAPEKENHAEALLLKTTHTKATKKSRSAGPVRYYNRHLYRPTGSGTNSDADDALNKPPPPRQLAPDECCGYCERYQEDGIRTAQHRTTRIAAWAEDVNAQRPANMRSPIRRQKRETISYLKYKPPGEKISDKYRSVIVPVDKSTKKSTTKTSNNKTNALITNTKMFGEDTISEVASKLEHLAVEFDSEQNGPPHGPSKVLVPLAENRSARASAKRINGETSIDPTSALARGDNTDSSSVASSSIRSSMHLTDYDDMTRMAARTQSNELLNVITIDDAHAQYRNKLMISSRRPTKWSRSARYNKGGNYLDYDDDDFDYDDDDHAEFCESRAITDGQTLVDGNVSRVTHRDGNLSRALTHYTESRPATSKQQRWTQPRHSQLYTAVPKTPRERQSTLTPRQRFHHPSRPTSDLTIRQRRPGSSTYVIEEAKYATIEDTGPIEGPSESILRAIDGVIGTRHLAHHAGVDKRGYYDNHEVMNKDYPPAGSKRFQKMNRKLHKVLEMEVAPNRFSERIKDKAQRGNYEHTNGNYSNGSVGSREMNGNTKKTYDDKHEANNENFLEMDKR